MAATSASSFSGVPPLARSLRRHLFPYAAPLLSLSVLAPSTPSLYSSRGFCHVAVCDCAKPSSEPLVRGIADKTLAETVKNILEKARRASSRREVLHSGFVTPPVVKETMLAIEKLTDVKAIAQGGYPQAERCRISVGHPGSMITDPDVIAALSISGNFKFEPCSHGDFLGAILGVGIKRDAVGDILMQGEKGAQVLVIPDMVDLLTSTLDKVGNVGVSCTQIPLLALEYEPPRTKSFKTVEPSLRVDALASAGFKLSRTKLVNLISNGDVRVNWSTVRKNGAALKTGDVVSVSGMGRLKIGEISTTRKGKYAVELIRYF
ncbi:RNA-binding S4 domain-containing protein [Rhynchospora pubera]|uniref:RNA-binding S4 domain-containing protein n=1 Tax=Rhynchospora pubera TaxID=906938 RepID=A0AAV8FV77_9POAL|nr:RNA-binding S4 domain-containing protein [Rhynchospora pubera]